MNSKLGRIIALIGALLVLLGIIAMVGKTTQAPKVYGDVKGYEVWDPEIIEAVKSLPIQDGGRVKPFASYAGFELLRINGKRKIRFQSNGEKVSIGAEEWMLDCFFRPHLAEQFRCIRVENDDVLRQINLEVEDRKRRDHYSFAELRTSWKEFGELTQKYAQMRENREELDQHASQVEALAKTVISYSKVVGHFALANERIEIQGTEGARSMPVSTFLKAWPVLRNELAKQMETGQELPEQIRESMDKLFRSLEMASTSEIRMYPPLEEEQEDWSLVNQSLSEYFTSNQLDEESLAILIEWETLVDLYNTDEKAFKTAFLAYIDACKTRSVARGEFLKHESELKYYKKEYFFQAMFPLLLGFLIVAVSWLSPGSKWSKWMQYGAWFFALWGLYLVTSGIVHRCILLERPPVGNLYDTIPFIAGVALLVLLLTELITRRGLCLGLALIVGGLGMLLVYRFEMGDGSDHMDPLVAVLRSNYWLTTHVIAITMGYAGGLVMSALSVTYVLARLLNLIGEDPSQRRFMTRVAYGMLCFTLLFSLVGTILGGVWANDSWGRFWGWDPKENGALMIVLWVLAVMHARMAGWIREWGFHACSVFTTVIVCFSWFHVNFLGTGLHSYGFSGGDGMRWLNIVYSIFATIMIIALSCEIAERLKNSKEIKK